MAVLALFRAGFADEQPARRYAQLELGWPAHRHEARRAVLGVEQRAEERVALAHLEEIHRPPLAERMHRARRRALLGDVAVASRHAVELVGRVQAEQVGDRLPFE